MPIAIPGKPSRSEIEQLLQSLEGVLAASAVLDPAGKVVELHVVAPASIHPKRVVRNVESALRAALGLDIDRRIVSVASIDADTNGDSVPDDTTPADEHADPAPPPDRLVFTGLEARVNAARHVTCTVVLRRGDGEITGAGEGPDTPRGRAQAAARATFAALAEITDDMVLEGVDLVQAHGRRYVHVGARGLHGRDATPLTGTAPIDQSHEEAGVLASLQATNRWTRPGS